jgi:hypothetical protein
MNESFLAPTFKWLWDHKPDLVIMAIIISAIIWTTTQIQYFSHRLDKVEESCTDIQRVQLPEIRKEIQQNKKELDQELFEIKLMLKRIDTYLTTKDKNYKGN